ncbi:MAG TPA: thiamine phosphate synthase [Nitrosomonas sp.]|nr:thiamine phosphate synthase [Nitrosomonas sp.]HRB96199.1 thiamine phosphate synthase [Nitrosomonas sp.]
MSSLKISGPYAITPDLNQTNDLLNKTRQVLEGGVKLVQYRNKSANESLRREQAKLLLSLCREHNALLIINDHLEIAIEIDADGVHVGKNDVSVSAAKNQLGQNKIVGTSCYNQLDLAMQAQKDGADYIAFGAFFSSLTKPNAVSVSISLVNQAQKALSIPIVGIGGIQLTNARTVIQSGCAAIAVCHDLFQAENIKATAEHYVQLFAETM